MGKRKGEKLDETNGGVSNKQTFNSKIIHKYAKILHSERIKKCDIELKQKLLSSFSVQNVVLNFDKFQHGGISPGIFRRYGENVISEKLKNFDVYSFENATITKRVTALKFHSKDPKLFAVGDKSGGLILRFLNEDKKVSWAGIGPGGSITSISFDPFTPDCLLTSSIDGTVKLRSYGINKCKILLDTECLDRWYCSVNASDTTGLVVAGDTKGVLTILSKEYSLITTHRLHKGKINTVEFCKNRSWLMATASLDRTVKLWDLRNIDPKSPLYVLAHNRPANAAYFSEVDGNRLLSTDQHSELRVYKAPGFELETRIAHPHRQFQHLTGIRACWHPLTDLVVVGRYPDPSWPNYTQDELRTIDVFSAATGEMKLQMYSSNCKGIVSLNGFNCSGDIMASGMGQYVAYWKLRTLRDRLKDSENKRKEDDESSDDDYQPPKLSPPKPTTSNKKTDKKV